MNKFNHFSLLTPDVWNNYELPIKNKIFTIQLLSYYLSKFWKDIMEKIDNKYIILLLRVQYLDNTIATLGKLQKINVNNYNELYEIFKDIFNWKGENYKIREIKNIIFSYKIIPEDKLIINKSKLVTEENVKITNKLIYNFAGWNLPNTMDFTTWGKTNFINDYKAIVYKKNSDVIYYINIYEKHIEVNYSISNRIIFSFTDTMSDKSDLSSFIRVIKNQEYIFENGQLIVKKVLRKCSYLQSINLSPFLDNNYITMDLETYINNEIVIPYCVSIFDGQQSQSFYLLDYANSDQMLTESVKFLMKRKYSG